MCSIKKYLILTNEKEIYPDNLLYSMYENLLNLNILIRRGIEIRLDFLSNGE